ncbi:hypothetical protein V1514DRAFT_331147 [Lipomyces japonicus]|uniref:uncharacterized protein n=1 Tax=Lipomyces japonicus TaxID=56871 RepID=UPI0034CF97FF
MLASHEDKSHNGSNEQVTTDPEPTPVYSEIDESSLAIESVDEQNQLDNNDSVQSPVSASPERVSSMTGVLNSSPEAPVSPKIVRASSNQISPIPPLEQSLLASAADYDVKEQLQRQDDQEQRPPPPPPRPVSPYSQAERTLADAFPNVDGTIIRAVLVASGGQIDPAFNALLGISDPSFVPDKPARKQDRSQQEPGRAPYRQNQRQLQEDEAFARKLAEDLNGGRSGRGSGRPQPQQQQQRQSYDGRHRGSRYSGYDGDNYYDDDENRNRDWSFFDDDLPIIKENLAKGFSETKDKVNNWVANLRKKLDAELNDERDDTSGGIRYPSRNSGVYGQPGRNGRQPGGSRSSSRTAATGGIDGGVDNRPAAGTRQQEYKYRISRGNSYDNDPTELDGNFAHLNLVDNTAAGGNNNNVESGIRTTRAAKFADEYEDEEEEDELYAAPAPLPARSSTGPIKSALSSSSSPLSSSSSSAAAAARASPSSGSSSRGSGKWEPLKAVEPTPDNDPFFIGDSDEEDGKPQSDGPKKTVRFDED